VVFCFVRSCDDRQQELTAHKRLLAYANSALNRWLLMGVSKNPRRVIPSKNHTVVFAWESVLCCWTGKSMNGLPRRFYPRNDIDGIFLTV